MDPAKLAKMCRCGHARRKHETGSIFVGYSTQCHEFHIDHPDGPDCFYFEPIEGWQESFVAALRADGYIVEKMQRDARGRFLASEGL